MRTFLAAFASLTLLAHAAAGAQVCPAEGDARGAHLRALNILKNRATAPRSDQIDRRVTLGAMLAPGNDRRRFDERMGAAIEGVVVRVIPGGIETVNCHARDLAYRDTHIELALSSTASSTERVIVEVTPRWGELMARQGLDWSTRRLNVGLVGRKVAVEGWLLFDREHAGESRNTKPGNPHDWRATAWEIHPVTAIRAMPRVSKAIFPRREAAGDGSR